MILSWSVIREEYVYHLHRLVPSNHEVAMVLFLATLVAAWSGFLFLVAFILDKVEARRRSASSSGAA